MIIWLLTHSEEQKKKSGTGKLVKKILQDQCHIIEWSRTAPDSQIVQLDPEKTAIVYLVNQESPTLKSQSIASIQNVIILDGTWQQARKMYNQSPYLKKLRHYEITGEQSTYTKRRNQKETGLCTAEVAIHLLKKTEDTKSAALEDNFIKFNQ